MLKFLSGVFKKQSTKTSHTGSVVQQTELNSTNNLLTDNPTIVGWPTTELQIQNFKLLLSPIENISNVEILDLGCGRGDMYQYLVNTVPQFNPTKYLGIDHDANLINVAKNKYSGINVQVNDIFKQRHISDWTVSSGLFNYVYEKTDMNKYLVTAIGHMYSLSRKGVAFNLFFNVDPTMRMYIPEYNAGYVYNELVRTYKTVNCFSDLSTGIATYHIYM